MKNQTAQEDSKSLKNRHDDRKKQFLEVAACLFAKYGLEGTTTKDIAKAAGVSPGLLYHYYSSKEDLLINVIKNFKRIDTETIDESILNLPAEEGLIRLMLRFKKQISDNRDIVWVVMRAAAVFPAIAKVLEEFQNSENCIITKFFKSKINSGEIIQCDAVRLSRCLKRVIVMESLYGCCEDNMDVKEFVHSVLYGIIKNR